MLNRALPRLPSATRAFLWWCAAAKFVVALVWTAPVLLPVLPAAERMADAATTSVRIVVEPQQTVSLQTPNERPHEARALPWSMLLVGGWCAGCFLSVYRGVGRWRRVRIAIPRSSPAQTRIKDMTGDLCRHLGLRRVPEVRLSEEVLTPLVTGLLRPVVLVPTDRFAALSERQQQMTLCHELAHLERADLWFGCVPALAERLFFSIRSRTPRRASTCSGVRRHVMPPCSRRSTPRRRSTVGCCSTSASRARGPASPQPARPGHFQL